MTSDNISINSDGVHVILDDGSEIMFASDNAQVKYDIGYSYNTNETQGTKIIVSDDTPTVFDVFSYICAGITIILFVGVVIRCLYELFTNF